MTEEPLPPEPGQVAEHDTDDEVQYPADAFEGDPGATSDTEGDEPEGDDEDGAGA